MENRTGLVVASSAVVLFLGVIILSILLAEAGSAEDAFSMVAILSGMVAGMLLAWIVYIVSHECAHAAMAKLVGARLFGITFGRGPLLSEARIGRTVVELRTKAGGLTVFEPTGSRWRDGLILLAGAGSEAAIVVVMLAWNPEHEVFASFRWAAIGVGVILLLLDLNPLGRITDSIVTLKSDGAQLLAMLRDPEAYREQVAALTVTPYTARLAQIVGSGAVDEARDFVARVHEESPDDPEVAATRGHFLLLDGRWRDAYEVLAPCADDAVDPVIKNNAAWAAVMLFDDDLLESADRWSAAAHDACPSMSAVSDTRGAVLTRTGRAAEALPLLRSVVADTSLSDPERAFATAFLALAFHQIDDRLASVSALARAIALDPSCPAIAEIERCVTASGEPVAGGVAHIED